MLPATSCTNQPSNWDELGFSSPYLGTASTQKQSVVRIVLGHITVKTIMQLPKA